MTRATLGHTGRAPGLVAIGGVGTTPHVHVEDLELYPNSRLRRVHVDTTDSWLEREVGPDDHEESQDDWLRYRGIHMSSAWLELSGRLALASSHDKCLDVSTKS